MDTVYAEHVNVKSWKVKEQNLRVSQKKKEEKKRQFSIITETQQELRILRDFLYSTD